MKQLRLLQLGDVHFPEHLNVGPNVDNQDPAFPTQLAEVAGTTPIENVLKEVCRILDGDVSALLLCGDLTSWGRLQDYTECVNYLADILELADKTKWPDHRIHVVPGNHDIDRSLCTERDVNSISYQKFQPLADAWSQRGLDVLPTQNLRRVELDFNGAKLPIFSLNSCLGCGERRRIPEEMIKGVGKLFDSHVAEMSDSDSFNIYEILDTPILDEKHITEIQHQLKQCDIPTVGLVLAHHNILPQRDAPRIALYTELINSGMIRSRLSACNHPILYCHGHIHDDPIEIITDASKNSPPLIAVSAPLLSDGFNEIELILNHDALPLGCIVTKYRIQRNSSVDPDGAKLRIPFWRPKDATVRCNSDFDLLQRIPKGSPVQFEDVRNEWKKACSKNISRKSVGDSLIELEWFGLVEIQNRDEDYKNWQLRSLNV